MGDLNLSGREKAVLAFWHDGMTDAEIAGKIGCTPEFVGVTRRRLEVAANKPGACVDEEAIRLREQRVSELWGEGLTDDQIAQQLGTSRSTVNRVRTSLGLARVLGRKSKVADEDLRELHADGKTDREMAAVFGVALKTVMTRRARLGLVRNRPSEGGRRPGPQAFTESELRIAHAEGLTDQQLADRFGVSTTVVGHWRREFGLPVHRVQLVAEPTEPESDQGATGPTEFPDDLQFAIRNVFGLPTAWSRLLPKLEPLVAKEMQGAGA